MQRMVLPAAADTDRQACGTPPRLPSTPPTGVREPTETEVGNPGTGRAWMMLSTSIGRFTRRLASCTTRADSMTPNLCSRRVPGFILTTSRTSCQASACCSAVGRLKRCFLLLPRALSTEVQGPEFCLLDRWRRSAEQARLGLGWPKHSSASLATGLESLHSGSFPGSIAAQQNPRWKHDRP